MIWYFPQNHISRLAICTEESYFKNDYIYIYIGKIVRELEKNHISRMTIYIYIYR